MLRVVFTNDDLVRTSVAPAAGPLWDVVFAGLRLRERHPASRRWAQEVHGRLDRRDPALRVLFALTPPGRPVPDLLTPPDGVVGLDDGLAALAATPPHRVREQLSALGTLPEWMAPLRHGEPRALAALADVVRRLHSLLVEPQAELLRESVEADRARRARDLVDGGVHGLLAALGPHARWEPPVLTVPQPVHAELHLRGRGLRLVPSYFCHGYPHGRTDSDLPPLLGYPIDEADRWPGIAAGCLDALLGSTRSAVLECVRTGAGTAELARRVGTSPASVSRHTGVLRAAGLLRSTRLGPRIVHTLTPLGESLVRRATT